MFFGASAQRLTGSATVLPDIAAPAVAAATTGGGGGGGAGGSGDDCGGVGCVGGAGAAAWCVNTTAVTTGKDNIANAPLHHGTHPITTALAERQHQQQH